MQFSTGSYCTCAKNPNVNDRNKLKYELGFLCETRFLPLIISTDDDGDGHVYVDGAHQVYQDGKGHSGLCLTIVNVLMMIVSKKLGLVTMSSIEMDVVSTDERFSR